MNWTEPVAWSSIWSGSGVTSYQFGLYSVKHQSRLFATAISGWELLYHPETFIFVHSFHQFFCFFVEFQYTIANLGGNKAECTALECTARKWMRHLSLELNLCVHFANILQVSWTWRGGVISGNQVIFIIIIMLDTTTTTKQVWTSWSSPHYLGLRQHHHHNHHQRLKRLGMLRCTNCWRGGHCWSSRTT